MVLEKYKQKRNFKSTPESSGDLGVAGARQLVGHSARPVAEVAHVVLAGGEERGYGDRP